jgi:hypothetical protein
VILAMTQLGALASAQNQTTAIGSNSIPFLSGALLKLVNNASVTLNGSTLWGSVSPFIGGYSGYADATLTWNAPTVNAANTVESVSGDATFRPTGSASVCNAAGIVITDSGSTSVFYAAPFDQIPIVLSTPLQQLQITLRFSPANPNGSIVQVLY